MQQADCILDGNHESRRLEEHYFRSRWFKLKMALITGDFYEGVYMSLDEIYARVQRDFDERFPGTIAWQ